VTIGEVAANSALYYTDKTPRKMYYSFSIIHAFVFIILEAESGQEKMRVASRLPCKQAIHISVHKIKLFSRGHS
jgi:hypothetical protein